MDSDNSGTVDFKEFLVLAIPGFNKSRPLAKPRSFALHTALHAMYQDAQGCGAKALTDEVARIPEQCIKRDVAKSNNALEHSILGSSGGGGASLELHLRFNKATNDSLGRTQSATDGSITLPLTLMKDNWQECTYPFEDKRLAHSSSGAGIEFTAAPNPEDSHKFPTPLSKLKCVKFPDPFPQVVEDGRQVDGFRILSVTPESIIITFDMKYSKYANFPPPPNEFVIVQTGQGTTIAQLKVT